ncbi:hypothetical protein HG1285_16266 [Hydrogenivirga sp. 128-5-R1-1]|nr:hypothetical protein HG1285_16266 [Hydrogenivirga sp. 128-5-R1-1]
MMLSPPLRFMGLVKVHLALGMVRLRLFVPGFRLRLAEA